MKPTLSLILSMIISVSLLNAETDYEKKARDALKKITTEQIKKIKEQSNSTNSANEKNIKGFVLSTHIQNFSDIPKSIDSRIRKIKEDIRLLIKSIALDIEINRGSSGVLSVDDRGNIQYKANSNLPKNLNIKRKQLLESNLKNSVSIKSASLAFQLLVNINKDLKEKAKMAKDRKTKERLYMTQAIYIYEMADIVLELLDNLSLEGKDTIVKLHQDAKGRVDKNIANIEIQKGKAKDLKNKGLINSKELTKELSDLELIRIANERSLDSWTEIMKKIGTQQNFLNKLKRQRDLIAYKRSKAKIQLETLRDISGVASLRDSIGSLDDIVYSVAQLDLLVLDERTVSSLLGYDYE